MNKYRILNSLAFPLILMMSGCSIMSGTPKSPLEFSNNWHDSHDSEEIINKYSKTFAEKATQIGTDPTKGVISENERNNLISMALTIMDYRYSEFVNGTETDRKNKEMVADFVELSMNLAGTAVGAAGTKTILAAISAGVNGINGSMDKNYFYEKTFQSLIAQMNADRKDILVYITQGMILPIDKYQWSQAVHDLIDYYNAGTLLGAISSIQKDAGSKEAKAENKIEISRSAQASIELSKLPVRTKINEFLDKIDTLSDDQAITLAKNPPVADGALAPALLAQFPTEAWATNPAAARAALKFRVTMMTNPVVDLPAWDKALSQ